MARTTTLGALRTRLEQLTDTENDQHLSTSEKNAALNSAMAETWDLILSAGQGDNYAKSVTFNTTSGTIEYPFATIVSAGDFYKVARLYVVENGNQLRPLTRVAPSELMAYKAPQNTVAMKMYYFPCCPVLSGDSDTFDGINGWEEHTLMVAAGAIKMKREEEYSLYARRRAELEDRIKRMAATDYGEPPRVVRKRSSKRDPFLVFSNNINAYTVRGANLELYYYNGFVPLYL